MVSANFVKLIYSGNLVSDLLVLVGILTVTACFITFLLLARGGKLQNRQKHLYVLVFIGVVMAMQVMEFVRFNGNFWQSIIIPTLTLGLSLIYYAFILICQDKVKVKKEHKELIELIDQKIEKEKEQEEFKSNNSRLTIDEILPRQIKQFKNNNSKKHLSCEECKLNSSKCIDYLKNNSQSKSEKYGDLDFSHVKNVIKRLEYYSLSQQEKQQVEELKGCLCDAERGDGEQGLKAKINDGLGALLKIMAKYGV